MRQFNTPSWLIRLFPKITWKFSSSEKVIYLTFDDGPVPEATPFVLEQLAVYKAEATFFCVGENAMKNPDLLKAIQTAGHSVGNHTYNHLNGWKTQTATYINNIEKCKNILPSRLFRPPYGKITPAQYLHLRKEYQLVLWDVVSYDFDAGLTPYDCLEALKRYVKAGSVVVFHDSAKSISTLRRVLPETLAYFSDLGYSFRKIQEN